MKIKSIILLFLLAILASCGSNLPEDVAAEYEKLPKKLDFNLHVKPILSDKCFLCHGPDGASRKAELRLDVADAAYAESALYPGKQAIKPGNLHKSEMFYRIITDDPELQMPLADSNLKLTAHEKAILVKWIEEGAKYKPHWAFIKPEKTTPPKISNPEWVKNPIDNFVAKKLEENNLSSSPEADKEILLRRLTFDLTGLPPTLEEINSFIANNSENAYEMQVDRLLASPQYGEKMAMDWMDVARYADTHGYTVDRYRDMSPWRDWVIKTYNENMSYDQFIVWQMAGDLLPNPTKEQLLATAFNRIHPQNMEGGIIPEEFRVEYVLDRVNTAGQAFLAMTTGCSKCHDHKYDPISQKEYYEMSAFFNNINESGQISFDNAMPVPTMLFTTERQDEIIDFLNDQVSEKENSAKAIADEEKMALDSWIAADRYKNIGKEKYPQDLMAHYEFENVALKNRVNPSNNGAMRQPGASHETPIFAEGVHGNGLLLGGDAWFDTNGVGHFRKNEPFSISIQVKLPMDIENGMIFHKGDGSILFNFRGLHLAMENNRLQLMMAHTAPDNAIIKYTKQDIPREEWLNFTMTYDGSGKAAGLRIYQNGLELETDVQIDNLYKDINFQRTNEPGIQVGARMRGKGIGGAVVDDLMIFGKELTPIEVLLISDRVGLDKIISKSPGQLSVEEKNALQAYYLSNESSHYKVALSEVEKARKSMADSVEALQEIMVMKEMPTPRKTFILERGIYDTYGEEVFPNTPESILPMPEDLPRNRLGFAKWLIHPDNPLTARVTVNRYWQNYFGRGLVRTTENFGNQGEMPSHPYLLDWLAVEFMDSGWNVKALQKLIVMSATYRQESKASKELQEKDGENILLARGPSARLTGEMLRDNALMASGLLNSKIGGKSVYPYQPAGLWRVNGGNYDEATGSDLYRRSLYTIWKRSVPHPTLSTFDAPDRSECVVRRQKTNTPLQALVLLNDPTFVETSKVIGENITKSENISHGISMAFTKLTGRDPTEAELSLLMELQEKELEKFKNNPEKLSGWLSAGESKTDQTLDANLVAANAVVASAIMNSDASITKR